MNPSIIYEDEYVLAINKPAGLITHSDGRTKEPSVADWIAEQYPALKDVGEVWISPQGEVVPRPGIVHRLDRTTSGVMVIAKTHEAHAFLKQQFQDRTMKKIYDALVYGHPKEEGGVIELEIGRTKKVPRMWTALPGKKGTTRAAITKWKVCGRYTDPESEEKVAHVEMGPKTGRTHQIRVHCKAIHHPILCDHIYAAKRPCLLGLSRPALHARSITLMLPGNGGRAVFEAPFPKDIEEALAALRGGKEEGGE